MSDCSRRKALKVAVCTLCAEIGYSSAEESALETLTEMIQSYIFELGRSTRAFCELACRTDALVSDVVMSLIEMGSDVNSIPAYAKRPNRKYIHPPQTMNQPAVQTKPLHVGDKKQHSSHIPDFLPPYPDPHTYIKTVTHREPEREYQILRDKAANQKRDVERALTRFIAKTGETESLFSDDPYAFPLIANKPKPLPYLDAILPKEQESEHGEDANKDNSLTSSAIQHPEPKQPDTSKTTATQLETGKASEPSTSASGATSVKVEPGPSATNAAPNATDNTSDSTIDNPYLRAILMPKIGKPLGKATTYSSSLKW